MLPAAVNIMGPLSAACAEPDNLRALTAVIDTSAQRAESAIRRDPGRDDCADSGSSM